jgi:SAM-dependent methyltransferase
VQQARYDRIGTSYAAQRLPDRRFQAAISAAIGAASTVVNVGAGTGSYEPPGRTVVAIEPAATMIAQRPADAAPAVQARAEALPLRTAAVDVALAVMTVHHWEDPRAGIEELRRVATRQVVLTFDAEVAAGWWLHDYLPELGSLPTQRPPAPDTLARWLGGAEIRPLLTPHDCEDGLMVAYWRRPWAYLDPGLHAGMSGMRLLDAAARERGLAALRRDLEDGSWERRYGDLLVREELDTGLRLLVGGDLSRRTQRR